MEKGTADSPVILNRGTELTLRDYAKYEHLHDDLGLCLKNRFGKPCEQLVSVVLFKPSGKYYTQERWRVPTEAIGPYDMDKSLDYRTIGGGAVLIDPQENEAFGYPHLFNTTRTDDGRVLD